MSWLCALLMLIGQDTEPDKFELQIDKKFLIGGVEQSFTLTINAVDKNGNILTTFNGTVELNGIYYKDDDGNKLKLESADLEKGEFKRDGLYLSGDIIRAQSGSVGGTLQPTVIPGWLTIVPPLLAIAAAIIFRQVLIALLAGIWIGVTIISGFDPFTAALRTFDTFILNSVIDKYNAMIIMFTLALGGMVGIISRSGGTKALVDAISTRAKTRRSGMLTTFIMGIVIFIDDYANCLLVGNTVRPLTDSKRISREKLAFIVDSTAAPVAGMAIISTWIGYELGQFTNTGVIAPNEAYSYFIATIPYRFYSILMLLFVFMICYTGRDFGPMYRAERRAITTGKLLADGAEPLLDESLTNIKVPEEGKRNLWNAVIPIVATIVLVVFGLWYTGTETVNGLKGELAGAEAKLASATGEAKKDLETKIGDLELGIEGGVFGNSDSFTVLVYAAFGGSLIALLMVLFTGALKLSEAMESWVTGCKAMIMAILILALAWTLGSVCRSHLQTGEWIIGQVSPPIHFLPVIIFLLSCLIAFSTGTSFGTMAIVFPIAGPLVWSMTTNNPEVSAGMVDTLRYATLGAVLTGAIFGDHCSPISDTTVMSSMSAGSDHVDHVRTQAPYALLVAGIAACVGFIPAGFGVPAWISLLAGSGIIIGAIFLFGKKTETDTETEPPK